ncbi:nucleoside-diphosphate kinase [archaeon]|nr:nucleoside-diphosphate kinase [archaeon]
MEQTFLMVKPDGTARGIVGEVISRIEAKGLKIVAMKMMEIDEGLAKRHYGEHEGKPFFADLVSFITSGPVVAMVVEGREAVNVCRALIGATDPKEAGPGTIRGDFGIDVGRNLVHGSDSLASAEREISLFFTPEEIIEYKRTDEDWLYEN